MAKRFLYVCAGVFLLALAYAFVNEQGVARFRLRDRGQRALYAALVSRADSALAHRKFTAAADAYRQASSTTEDKKRFAANQLDMVEVRPYRVRLQSVLVKPTRPDGEPWAGRPNPALVEQMASPTGFEPVSPDRKSGVLDQPRRWGRRFEPRASAGVEP